LIALLKRSKVVINIHYYEDALLETTRISEALSYGARVVSETARDQDNHSALNDVVDFVPANDLPTFIAKVRDVIDNYEPLKLDTLAFLESSPWSMRSLLLRALNGIGILSYEEFDAATSTIKLASDRVILCLPESLQRFQNARKGLAHAALFPGLRHIEGWKGCALSYKYLAKRALDAKITPFVIWEDDAEFGDDFPVRFETILSYLANSDDWDIFSGLLSDLSPEAEVRGIEAYNDEVFIKVDSVIGMVFSIYNLSALKLISQFLIVGEDAMKYTIDRYLESQDISCITVFPPLAAHSHNYSSTLWSPNGKQYLENRAMIKMITASQNRLFDKISGYLTQRLQNTTANL